MVKPELNASEARNRLAPREGQKENKKGKERSDERKCPKSSYSQ